MTILSAVVSGNYDNRDYDSYLTRFNKRFLDTLGTSSLFTTDAEGLYEAYLDGFGNPADRQHHTCHACRHFINRFAGLVTIDEHGKTTPALVSLDDDHYGTSLAAMAKIVRKAKVTGVFLSSEQVLGTPITGKWRHLSVAIPKAMVYPRTLLTANQKMAEKREDFINVNRALAEFPQPVIEQALTLLKTDSLYRSEKVIGPAQWLYDLHVAKAASHHKVNMVWRAIATAPAGFCHPRASMVGTLLEDIATGMDFAEVSRRFQSKMHPLQYQRPQAAPNAGAIAQAEKVVAELGAAGSLARRFARLDEIQTIWTPRVSVETPKEGVFGHLKPKGALAPINISVPAQTMTWDKFSRTVLLAAEKIEFYARASRDNFSVLVTAVNADAPPILQWDSLEQRNPVSWYVWHGGSPPAQFGLRTGSIYPISAITFKPSMWGDNKHSHQGEAVIFLIEGARETRQAGAALFPEILKSDFHGIRSVIEAYSRNAEIEGMDGPQACGILLQKGTPWEHMFRVTTKGHSIEYRLDRWD